MDTDKILDKFESSPIGKYIVKKYNERKLEEDSIHAVNVFNFKMFAYIHTIKNEINKETFDNLMYFAHMFSIQLEKNLNINSIEEYQQLSTILDIYKEYLIEVFINHEIDNFYTTVYIMFSELAKEGLMYEYSVFNNCDYYILDD